MSTPRVAVLASTRTHCSPLTNTFAEELGCELGKAGAIVVPGEGAAAEVACAHADVIVVLQSTSHRCPSFRAASRAFEASKRVWVVPPAPWLGKSDGSLILIRRPGVRALWRTRDLLVSLGLAKPGPERHDPDEQRVVEALKVPLHKDRLLAVTLLTIPRLSTALFNLLIDGVIREGLDGRFELSESGLR